MGAMKGDFLGFTFDGIHSSELGIMRVSDGSRYSENLLPSFQDKTTQIPGNDGTYYHGSYYTQRQFNISIAFDDLSEEQLRRLKQIFGDKNIHSLIFDEVPYKVYKVKTTGAPNLKYVCFDNVNDIFAGRDLKKGGKKDRDTLYNSYVKPPLKRVYKGEGQLNFIAYTPYARSRFKYIDEYNNNNIKEWGPLDTNYAVDVNYNFYSWKDSVNLLNSTSKKMIGDKKFIIDKVEDSGVFIYNPGDLETDFILKFRYSPDAALKDEGNFSEDTEVAPALAKNESAAFPKLIIGNVLDKYIELNGFKLFKGDSGIQINTKLNLIEGIDMNGNITGTIYNKFIIGGDFFKIPVTKSLTLLPFTSSSTEDGPSLSWYTKDIEYYYLFF